MFITHTHADVSPEEKKLKATLTTTDNDWRVKVELTRQSYFYLSKEEAYQLASSLELALLELNDDEEQA